ncbi:MAG: hypothetical protein AB2708_08150, partial [Candidatus Thiodiazotropha taylori]
GYSCQWQKESIRKLDIEKDKDGVPVRIKLTISQCTAIDSQWSQLLHRVEAILMAWETRAADRKTIEKQFMPLLRVNEKTFRNFVGARPGEFPVLENYLKMRLTKS